MSDYNQFGKIANKPRSQKLKPKIDLTAMVSISFLLIIFFMVTIELSKPKTIELGTSSGCGGDYGVCYKPDFKRMVTLLLDDNDKVISYLGLINYPEESPKILSYGKNGIRKELLNKDRAIKEYMSSRGRPDLGTIVIIKPSKKSNYGNLVNILDEMAIANISTYAIVNDFTPEELNLLASK
jgi:biopolymer transport protein ExbD